MKSNTPRHREIEIEFGFRYTKKDVRSRIIRMANEIGWLRAKLARRDETIKGQADRIRDLELQISSLDYKLRG